MELAFDLNLILRIIFGLLGIFLVGLWIAVPFVIFSMRKSLNETNRRLEKILLELKTLSKAMRTQAAPIEEKSENRRQRHTITQLYRTPKEEDPNK